MTPDRGHVEVRRSRRRRRTVSAYREGETTVIAIPASFTRAQEDEWVDKMLGRLERKDRRARPTDGELLQRAHRLSSRYLGGMAEPVSVTWVDNQRSRWGSCTPMDRTIRLSSRMRGFPAWVVDYVLVHELAHLIFPNHTKDFWDLVAEYPDTERAQGFLSGYEFGRGMLSDDPQD